MSEHACFNLAFPSRSPFGRVLSLGWYDGTTSGLAQCSQCLVAYKYDIVDWDSNQEHRMFAFSPIGMQEFEQIVDLLRSKEQPAWPFWNPRWRFARVEKEQIKHEIDTRLAQAKDPEYLVASDRQLETFYAAKRLSGSALDRLPAVFDGLPVSDNFDYWKKYVGLND